MKKTILFTIFLTVVLASPNLSAGPAEFIGPIPLQDSEGVTVIPAENIISINHPPVGNKNFMTNKIVWDGVTYYVDDFVLTPGGMVDQNLGIFAEGAMVGARPYDFYSYSLKGRDVVVADVRMAAGELPLVHPLIFIDDNLNPYENIHPQNPTPVPAYSITRFDNGDFAVVTHDIVGLRKAADGTPIEFPSPIFYFSPNDEGLYRLKGALAVPLPSEIHNQNAMDIEALDINGDGHQDIAVLNYDIVSISTEGYVTFWLGQGGEGLNNQFELLPKKYGQKPKPKLKEGFDITSILVPPFDSAVVIDEDENGNPKESLIVPYVIPAMGHFFLHKFYYEGGSIKHSPIQIPFGPVGVDQAIIQGNIIVKETKIRLPARIKCADLNGDGCGDCVITLAHVDFEEPVEEGQNVIFDYTIMPESYFAVLFNAKANNKCLTNQYFLWQMPPPGVFVDDEGLSQERLFAPDILDVNNDGVLDVLIGDQALHNNDRESYIYSYMGQSTSGVWSYQSWDDMDPNKKLIGIHQANFSTKYINPDQPRGVKAITHDRSGNLGIVNGPPFEPAIKLPLPEEPIVIDCRLDYDSDELYDYITTDLPEIEGSVEGDLDYADKFKQYVVQGKIILNCDTCTTGDQNGNLDQFLKDLELQYLCTSGNMGDCNNELQPDGTFKYDVMALIESEDNLPDGCKEPEIVECAEMVQCDSGEWVNYEENKTLFGEDNDKEPDCIPDCIMPETAPALVQIPPLYINLIKCDKDAVCGCTAGQGLECDYVYDIVGNKKGTYDVPENVVFNTYYDADHDCVPDCVSLDGVSGEVACDDSVFGLLPECEGAGPAEEKCPGYGEQEVCDLKNASGDSIGSSYSYDIPEFPGGPNYKAGESGCVPDCVIKDGQKYACDNGLNLDYCQCPPTISKYGGAAILFRCPIPNDGENYIIDYDIPGKNNLIVNGEDNDEDNDCVPKCEVNEGGSGYTGDPCDPYLEGKENDVEENWDNTKDKNQCSELSVPPSGFIDGAVFKFVHFLSRTLISDAHAGMLVGTPPSGPMRSEATVLINKGAVEKPPIPWCEEHPDDPKCKPEPTPVTPGPEVKPVALSEFGQCVVDIDRGAAELNPFQLAIKALNDEGRAITGLNMDIFAAEMHSTYKMTLWIPVAQVLKEGATGFMSPYLFKVAGMRDENYPSLSYRPNAPDYKIKVPIQELPSKMMMEKAGLKAGAGFDIISDAAVVQAGINLSQVNNAMQVKAELVQGALESNVGVNESVVSPLKVTQAGIVGMGACEWASPRCPDPIVYQDIDPRKVIEGLKKLVDKYKAEGRPVTPQIFTELFDGGYARWDKYLLQKWQYNTPLAEASSGAKAAGLVAGMQVSENMIQADIKKKVAEEGWGCFSPVIAVVPALGEMKGGCSCRMSGAAPEISDLLGYMLVLSLLIALYITRRVGAASVRR